MATSCRGTGATLVAQEDAKDSAVCYYCCWDKAGTTGGVCAVQGTGEIWAVSTGDGLGLVRLPLAILEWADPTMLRHPQGMRRELVPAQGEIRRAMAVAVLGR